MNVNTVKKYLYGFISCVLLGVTLLILSGCTSSSHVVNTRSMPGHRFTNVLKNVSGQQTSKDSPLVRTKSGVYIYKDNSTVNTTGYRFRMNDSIDIGPTDVRFDAEHFRTRY